MAVVEMRHVKLLGMRTDEKKILRIMQKMGCVEITEMDAELSAFCTDATRSAEDTEEKLTKIRWAMNEIRRYAPENISFLNSFSMPQASEEEFEAIAGEEANLFSVIAGIEECEKRRGDLRSAEIRIKGTIEQLLPWQDLDIPIEKLSGTETAFQRIGSMPERLLPRLQEAMVGHSVTMQGIGSAQGRVNIWLLAHQSEEAFVAEALVQANFTETKFGDETGTINQILARAKDECEQLQAKQKAIADEICLAAPHLPQLKILFEIISSRKDREKAAGQLAKTGETFFLTGWLPANKCEALEKAIQKIAPDYAVSFRDADEDEKPPVLLKNNRFSTPFESIMTSFSLPDPRGLDPTFVMAPFFLCFFGMMVSDAGYGLVMAILMPLAIYVLKPRTGMKRLMFILGIGGVATVFWGAMFDTWFGMSIKPMLVNPLEEPLKMMAICLGFGAVHLFFGLFVGAYVNFKRKKPWDALFDQFSWFFLIVGVGLMLLPTVAAVGKVMAIAAAVLIALTASRQKKNWIARIMGGLGALYGVTSWLSDLLSYMRLFGMGLATGVIGMVINQLAGLLFGKNIVFTVFGVLLLIGGHIFNAIINTIGAYVHASRLQYIEFFSKFFEDGGRAFAPLTHHPRYVEINDSSAGRTESSN